MANVYSPPPTIQPPYTYGPILSQVTPETLMSGSGKLKFYQANQNLRNTALFSYLNQLNQPYQYVYEAQNISPYVQNFQNARRDIGINLAGRGLSDSGARALGEQNLQKEYAGGLYNALTAAQQAENQRKQQLLSGLQNLSQADIQNLSDVAGGLQTYTSGKLSQSYNDLLQQYNYGKGAALLAASVIGGAAGAAGAGGTAGGITGAAQGVYGVNQGMNVFSPPPNYSALGANGTMGSNPYSANPATEFGGGAPSRTGSYSIDPGWQSRYFYGGH